MLPTNSNAMKTSAIFACILLPFALPAQVPDSIRLVTLEALQQSEETPVYVSSLLTASRDPVAAAAAFNFSAVRFKQRGYDADLLETGINGLPMQSLENGYAFWSSWSGLNEMLLNRQSVAGGKSNSFAFGLPGGFTHIDMRAGKQRRQTATGYAFANRQYTHRFYYARATGFNSKGWALAYSLVSRTGSNGYVEAADYNSHSYYAAVDKKAGTRHLFSLAVFGAATRAGRQAATLQQTAQLTNNNYYNAYWGYQDGRKRNSSYSIVHQPQLIATHDYHPNSHTSVITALGITTGSRKVTGLDWYNAADPRPDYYRYLPGYAANAAQRTQLEKAWAEDEEISQVNWNRLYAVNRANTATIYSADGMAGNHITGLRSLYIVQAAVNRIFRLAANSVLNTHVGRHAAFTAGISYQRQQNRRFKQINDLLGGDWFVDWNQFAERDDPGNNQVLQNNLDKPNRLVRQGETFGYDYSLTFSQAAGFMQLVYTLPHVDLFAGGNISRQQYFRTGYMRNGLFADNSLGRSATHAFTGYGYKAGFTYKINGRHYAYIQAAVISRPPLAANVYLSPRTRNTAQANAVAETIQTAEAGYLIHAPRLSIHASAYITQMKQGMKVLSFYHDEYRNFVNYALSNINKWHGGVELAAEASVTPDITFTAVAAVGRYYYNSRQQALVTADNSEEILEKATVYSKNYRVGNTPQEAYSAGITYRSPDAWFISTTTSYTRRQWLEANPLRLTAMATDNVSPGSDEFKDILQQTEWPAQYTVNLFAGYTCKAPYKRMANTWMTIYAGVNNLLNNTRIISGAYEQLRFDFESKSRHTYPPKMWYAQGTTFYLSINFRFQ